MNLDSELVPGLVVSRETRERLAVYEILLRKWQAKINLISQSTLQNIWVRHFADSAQILRHRPHAKSWVDLGSGAGFPGLVLGIQLCQDPDALVHLIEADGKKCAFLREVIRETGSRAFVHNGRIESIVSELPAEVVVARALAPLPKLLEIANPLLMKGALGVFLKGQEVASELTALPASSSLNLEIRSSLTNAAGKIVLVSRRLDTRKNEDLPTCPQIPE